MQFDQVPSGSGHVFRVERKAGPVWYAKYRLPDGHQHKKKIGPAWTGRGRSAEGFDNERTANDWLDDVLERAREQVARGAASGDDVLFETAALEWLRYCEEGDLVFPGEDGLHLDGSAWRRRYRQALERAGPRKLRFHDLRHTFATRLVAKADIVRVQEWMGHADIQTTRKYLHFVPRPDDALLVAAAFEASTPPVLASVVSPANVEVATAA
jgi:integrase